MWLSLFGVNVKLFKKDSNGDFTDDRIVFVIFGVAFLLTGLVEGIPL